jgi:hypothetical protein
MSMAMAAIGQGRRHSLGVGLAAVILTLCAACGSSVIPSVAVLTAEQTVAIAPLAPELEDCPELPVSSRPVPETIRPTEAASSKSGWTKRSPIAFAGPGDGGPRVDRVIGRTLFSYLTEAML